jgi:hypothetical protein
LRTAGNTYQAPMGCSESCLRPAVPADAALIVEYIRELAEFEREPEAAVVTEADIHRYAFSEHPLVT